MAVTDDIAAIKAEITTNVDGTISGAASTAAASLTMMQAYDAALADLQTAIAAERAKLAVAMPALAALQLTPPAPAPAPAAPATPAA